VVISADAKTLREEFQTRLVHLQESCRHETTKLIEIESAPGRLQEIDVVCLKCEKILERETGRDFAR
jgi:hypothetical protein